MRRDVDIIGSSEKRAIADIVLKQYDEAISKATKVQQDLMESAEKEVRKELQVDMIMTELRKLDAQKDVLLNKLHDMGFEGNSNGVRVRKVHDRWFNDSGFDTKTLAGRRAMEALEKMTNLSELQVEKNVKIKKIWLATSRKQVEKLAGNGYIKVELIAVDKKQIAEKIEA